MGVVATVVRGRTASALLRAGRRIQRTALAAKGAGPALGQQAARSGSTLARTCDTNQESTVSDQRARYR